MIQLNLHAHTELKEIQTIISSHLDNKASNQPVTFNTGFYEMFSCCPTLLLPKEKLVNRLKLSIRPHWLYARQAHVFNLCHLVNILYAGQTVESVIQ